MIKKMMKKVFKENKELKHTNTNETTLIKKITHMDLRSMIKYIQEPSAELLGMEEILKKVTRPSKSQQRRFLEITDSNAKITKCFDLVISIVEHEKAMKSTVVLVQQFIYYNEELIKSYDKINNTQYYINLNNAVYFISKKLTPSVF